MKLKIDNFVIAFLIILILNVSLHLYELGKQITWVDEPIYVVGGAKLLLQKGAYDPLLWNFEHPPAGKYLIGLATLLSPANLKPLIDLSPNNYLGLGYPAVAKAIDESLPFSRLSPALFGILLSIIICLFAKDLYGKKAGLLAFLISTISIDLLTWSRLAYLDIFLAFFFTVSSYIFYKLVALSDDATQKTKNRKIAYSILLGVFVGLTFTAKSTQPMPLIVSLFILSLFYRKKVYTKNTLPFIAIPLAISIFSTIGNLELFSKATFDYFGATSRQLSFNPVNNAVRVFERVQLPLLGLFFVSVYFLWKKKALLKNKIILIPILIAFLSFIFSVNTSHRYFLPMIPFLIILSSSINLENKNLKFLCFIALILATYPVIESFPEYTLYTNTLDKATGNNYFWEEAGFAGLDEAAKYVSSNTSQNGIIFITQDAIRYRVFNRPILAYEGGQTLLYLPDGQVGQTSNIFCDGLSKFRENNITTLIIQNPMMLDKSYCEGIRQLYNTEKPTQVITKNGMDVIKIFSIERS